MDKTKTQISPERNGKKHDTLRNLRNGIVVRIPDRLSDAVMTIPALKVLKESLPEHCGLFVIIPAFMTQLFEALPIVDKTVTLRKSKKLWTGNERREVRRLRAGAIVIFNRSAKDVISAKLAGIPQIIGFSGSIFDILLSAKIPFVARKTDAEHHSPIALQYLELAKAAGAGEWDGVVPPIASRIATAETEQTIHDICRHTQLLLIAPGVSGPPCWPSSGYRAVAKYWIRHGGIVAIIGSAGERSLGNAICSSLPKNKYFNLCGKTDICALLHLFRSAAYTIAGDSGLMRLGIALDIHGLVPVGPADFADTDPVTSKWKILFSKRNCPGAKGACNHHGNCAHLPTVHQVLKAIHQSAKELHFPFRETAKK